MCAVLSGGVTALLLAPGTGICKPAFGVAARYRRTVAAGDETAQADPTVPPFYPAIRVIAVRPAIIAALPTPSGHPGVARTFDVIALTGRERKGSPPFLRPWPAGSLGDWVACVGRTLTY